MFIISKFNKMKKGLINEAFRLQQLAGIRPVNEMFGSDNDQYSDKYSDVYSRVDVSDDGVYSAKDPSDKEAVRLADALTALYDEHGENGIDSWQSGAIDIEDFMNESGDPDLDDDPNFWNLSNDEWDAIDAGADPDEVRYDKYNDPDARRDARDNR
jgi:hypothetical protein